MTDKIEPALTPEEWRDALSEDMRDGLAYEVSYLWGRERPHAAIAIANAALPDSDPRKLAREMVRYLLEIARFCESVSEERTGEIEPETKLRDIAAALESYLPPEIP